MLTPTAWQNRANELQQQQHTRAFTGQDGQRDQHRDAQTGPAQPDASNRGVHFKHRPRIY